MKNGTSAHARLFVFENVSKILYLNLIILFNFIEE